MSSKKGKWALLLLPLLGLVYLCRGFLPFMFFDTDYIEIELNVPESVRPDIGGTYRSWSCQEYSIGSGDWTASKANYKPTLHQQSPTRYLIKMPLYDNSLCGWSLYHFGWTLLYREPQKLDSRVTYAGGASITFSIAREKKSYSSAKYIMGEVNLERQYKLTFMDFSQSKSKSAKGRPPNIVLRNAQATDYDSDDRLNRFAYNPYSATPRRITLTATLDDSQLYDRHFKFYKKTGIASDE